MRLWHESLIPFLPRQQLLGQHRECCALRGLGWGKPHSVVNYVFDHPREWLWVYHMKVMWEMESRGYSPNPDWKNVEYRGSSCDPDEGYSVLSIMRVVDKLSERVMVYPEHNEKYLLECIDNLKRKGVEV